MNRFLLFIVLSFALVHCQLTLDVVVRDFSAEHPDFEGIVEGHTIGYVEELLDEDRKPVRSAQFSSSITSADSFRQWYRDEVGVNVRLNKQIIATETAQGSGVFSYQNSAYFPIDDEAMGNEGNSHNYHFTTEIHTTFQYVQGTNFEFTGDDDVWVFVNGRLALDLGGVHSQVSGTITLDDIAASHGLVAGQNYPLDIFHAERHTVESNFKFTTTMALVTVPPDDDTPGRTVWLCGVRFDGFCADKSASQCPRDPMFNFPGFPDEVSFENYQTIVFRDFALQTAQGRGGDIEGRLAVGRDFTSINGFSVGQEINTGNSGSDVHVPFALVVGRDGNFQMGSVKPDGTDIGRVGDKEDVFAGGNWIGGTTALQNRRTGTCPDGETDCLSPDFTNALNYFNLLQEYFAEQDTNAQVVLVNNEEGGKLVCDDASDLEIYAQISGEDLSKIKYWQDTDTATTCNKDAQFVITVTGTGNVIFGGSPFRYGAPAEDNSNNHKLLFNVLGEGRLLSTPDERNHMGILLAPNNDFSQKGGSWDGIVIVRDVISVQQINRFHCPEHPNPPNPPPPPKVGRKLCPYFEGKCPGLNLWDRKSVNSFRDYDVISFGNFVGRSGDVEGRLAVRNNADLVDYTIGFKVLNKRGADRHVTYALIVGHDLSYTNGQVHPYGGAPDEYPGFTKPEYVFVGGEATLSGFDETRITGSCGSDEGCLDARFDAAKQCYLGFSEDYANREVNTRWEVKYGGLFITCNARRKVKEYIVNIDTETFSSINWYSLSGCNAQARWVINIKGSGDVVFTGGSFPANAKGLLFNIVGRHTLQVTAVNVNGHILAPNSVLNQTNSVITGKVVVGNVIYTNQFNRPCPVRFAKIQNKIRILIKKAAKKGEKKVKVENQEGDVLPGDEVEGGNTVQDVEGDEVTFEEPIEQDVNEGDFFEIVYDEEDSRILPEVEDDTPVDPEASSSVALAAIFSFIVAIIALF